MSIRVSLLLKCVFVFCVAGGLYASEKDPKALDSLVERLQSIHSISGSFVQFTEDQKGVRFQESSGSFKAKRPDFFYWYAQSPLEQVIYSDGHKVTVYDPDLEQATVQIADPRTQNTPAVLFSGNVEQIGALYHVSLVESEEQADTGFEYALTPKGEDSLFEALHIRFQGKQLTDMRLKDSLGQRSVISFVQTQINPDLPDAEFVPELPEGTDIIEDLPLGSLQP